MTPMSSFVLVPDPSMAESPLDSEEGINECVMFSSALESAVLAESGHSSCDEESDNSACDADNTSEVPEKSTIELGVRRSSRTARQTRLKKPSANANPNPAQPPSAQCVSLKTDTPSGCPLGVEVV